MLLKIVLSVPAKIGALALGTLLVARNIGTEYLFVRPWKVDAELFGEEFSSGGNGLPQSAFAAACLSVAATKQSAGRCAVGHAAANAILRDRRLGRVPLEPAPVPEHLAAFRALDGLSLLEMEPPAQPQLGPVEDSADERVREKIEAYFESGLRWQDGLRLRAVELVGALMAALDAGGDPVLAPALAALVLEDLAELLKII